MSHLQQCGAILLIVVVCLVALDFILGRGHFYRVEYDPNDIGD